jgi:hypothetical protein
MVAGAIAVLAAAGGCSSGSGSTAASSGGSSGSGSSSGGLPVSSASAASTSGSGAAGASVPKSCNDIPASELLPYAKVALVKSFPRTTPGVTCEFASADASQVVILTVGPGSSSSFAQLETSTRNGPVTVAPLHGLGQQAFTISRGGKVAGVDLLTSDDVTIALGAALAPGQVQRLASKLAARY